MQLLCPCHSQKSYYLCCEPFHLHQLPETAVALMRSRYSAYALGLANYIILTTHPQSPLYQANKKEWKNQILQFAITTKFIGLQILEEIARENTAHVTFFAELLQNEKDVSFTERSYFLKENARWFYHSGTILM